MSLLVSAIVAFALTQHHRNLLPVAIVATALLMLLDVRYRSVQLRHVDRVGKVEEVIIPQYRLRPRSQMATMAKPDPEKDWMGQVWLVGVVLCRRAFPLAASLEKHQMSDGAMVVRHEITDAARFKRLAARFGAGL